MKWLLLPILLGAVVLPFLVWAPSKDSEEYPPDEVRAVSLLLVGDIMLGRGVETRIEEFGMDHPYTEVRQLLEGPDVTIGNFEGVVSEPHVHTPSMTFQFSVKEGYVRKLDEVGFDVLSLANNHSLDYGEGALESTRALCEELSLVCGGTPLGVNEYSTRIIEAGPERIGIVFLHTVWEDVDRVALNEAVGSLIGTTTFQIAYIHWGTEYELVHNASQEALAKELIDAGIDAVIGHHPHVVQDIDLYRGKPIFYSLGNFIFDQYFSREVQEGLAVAVTLEGKRVRYDLLPHESRTIRIQPRMLPPSEADALFRRIMRASDHLNDLSIKEGTFSLPR